MDFPSLRRGTVAAFVFVLFVSFQAQPQERPALSGELTADVATYIDVAHGSSSIDFVRRALTANRDLAASELSIARARARLVQAGLLPNPTLDLEHARGSGESTDQDTAVGLAMPLELGGKRATRIEIATAELQAAEVDFEDRRRRVVADVMTAYIEALAALRELDVTARLNDLDADTGKYVQARVSEGDAPPLELNLLRVEIERLRARRIFLRGEVDAAVYRLRTVAGIPADEPLRFALPFASLASADGVPASAAEAVRMALDGRPDLRLARLNETIAAANLRAAHAQAFPDVTLFAKYERERSNIEESPIGFIGDPDRHIGLGISLSLPFFNRYQGLRAEAETAIQQAKHQREFTESVVRGEVESAYRRLQASDEAVRVYEAGVIEASMTNIGVIQAAYKLGEYRITDLIAERRRFTDSQREFTELLAERQRALSDLHIAIGTFVPEEVNVRSN